MCLLADTSTTLAYSMPLVPTSILEILMSFFLHFAGEASLFPSSMIFSLSFLFFRKSNTTQPDKSPQVRPYYRQLSCRHYLIIFQLPNSSGPLSVSITEKRNWFFIKFFTNSEDQISLLFYVISHSTADTLISLKQLSYIVFSELISCELTVGLKRFQSVGFSMGWQSRSTMKFQ